jgi:hypothetical protein
MHISLKSILWWIINDLFNEFIILIYVYAMTTRSAANSIDTGRYFSLVVFMAWVFLLFVVFAAVMRVCLELGFVGSGVVSQFTTILI